MIKRMQGAQTEYVGTAPHDALARLLATPGALRQPSLVVRCKGSQQAWTYETVVEKSAMRFRLHQVLLPRIEEFAYVTPQPFDFFFLVSDSLYPTDTYKDALCGLIRQVPFFRCDQRRDDPASMASTLIPDYSLLSPDFAAEFSAVVSTAARTAFQTRLGQIAWRGRLSGPGYPDINNCQAFPRFHLLRLAQQRPDVFHARLTDDSNLYGTPAKDLLRRTLAQISGPVEDPWPVENFVRYKYLISLDGAVAAWKRVPTILASGSVLLLQADWQQEFYSKLTPWQTYVPVSRDLSDLLDAWQWLEAHPDKAEEIAAAGQELALSHLTPKAVLQRFLDTLLSFLNPDPMVEN